MNKFKSVSVRTLTAMMFVAAQSYAQAPPPMTGGPPTDAAPAKAVALGPYAVTVASDPSLPTHTIYRPSNLGAVNGKLPIVAWGNGGCINSGRAYEKFLTKIASHGFFIVAIGPDNVPEPDLSKLKPGEPLPPLSPEMISRAAQLIDGIDWAIAQNDRNDSPYAKKLDTKAIGVMGQSCGGLQTLAVAKDARIKTAVIWNSGVFVGPMPANAPMRNPVASKEDLKTLHAPLAYFIGGPSDSAYKNAEDDFTKIEGPPLFNANLNVGHGGTFRQPNGGWFGEVGTAWLQWRLQGNQDAAKMFEGEKCGLCMEPAWKVKKKNMN